MNILKDVLCGNFGCNFSSVLSETCLLSFTLVFFKQTVQRHIEIINPNTTIGGQLSITIWT